MAIVISFLSLRYSCLDDCKVDGGRV